MKISMNEKQVAFVNFLKANEGKEFTLAEISESTGVELKSGTINCIVGNVAGIRTTPKGRTIVCECCGHKTKVSTYSYRSED